MSNLIAIRRLLCVMALFSMPSVTSAYGFFSQVTQSISGPTTVYVGQTFEINSHISYSQLAVPESVPDYGYCLATGLCTVYLVYSSVFADAYLSSPNASPNFSHAAFNVPDISTPFEIDIKTNWTIDLPGSYTLDFRLFVNDWGQRAPTGLCFALQPMCNPSAMNDPIFFPYEVTTNFSVSAVPVPEPETYALLFTGFGILGFVARRQRQKRATI